MSRIHGWRAKAGATLSQVSRIHGRRLTRRGVVTSVIPFAALALASRWIAERNGPPSQSPIAQSTATAAVIPGIAADGSPPAVPLRAKIGQMILAGFRGLEISEGATIAADIAERNLGGVVLFDYDVPLESPVRNIASPAQVAALTAQLQGLAPTPLLIGIDQEGGLVARLDPDHGFPATQSPAQLGALNDPEVTYAAAAQMAQTLAAAGANLNFAPVVDLNVNPANPVIGALGRSFSADPAVVTAMAEAFIRAHHDHGILCALKHFPGHGSSTGDSHLGFTDVTGTWSSVELEPFANIIAAGLADTVMTAHVFNANLDADYPATLSFDTITGILRNELGFEGVVFSDDLQMAAITQQFGFEFAVEHAIQAGVDVLLFGNNLVYDETTVARVIDLVESLVEAGTISEARIDLSYARIQALKSRL